MPQPLSGLKVHVSHRMQHFAIQLRLSLTPPAARAPARGASAMTKATVAFLMAVRRLNTGVYSSVAPADRAMMLRS